MSAAALGHLRSLTLIRNGLAEPPRLGSCSRTLTRLCLVHQGLSSTDGLEDLPALEELVLSANRLERFGGLPGCRALRRLWLDPASPGAAVGAPPHGARPSGVVPDGLEDERAPLAHREATGHVSGHDARRPCP